MWFELVWHGYGTAFSEISMKVGKKSFDKPELWYPRQIFRGPLDWLHNRDRCNRDTIESRAFSRPELCKNWAEIFRTFCRWKRDLCEPGQPCASPVGKNINLILFIAIMYSRLSRCCTARGSSTGFSRFSPTKVDARKSFLFNESFLVLKVYNTNLKNMWLFLYIWILVCFVRYKGPEIES